MTTAELTERLLALEKSVEVLKTQLVQPDRPRRWWVENAGRFANDSVFDEMVRLGSAYRDSLRHRDRKKKS